MSENIYRVSFFDRDHEYSIYAKMVAVESPDFLGFVEVSDILFDYDKGILFDPSNERLKHEFKNVKRTFIPLHSIIRIDEFEGHIPPKTKITDRKKKDKDNDNIRHFPGDYVPSEK